MVSLTFTLVSVVALTVAGGQRIPFKPSLLNTKYEAVTGQCGFPGANSAKVTIEIKRLRYVPTVINDPRHGYDGRVRCPGFIELYYKHRPYHMSMRMLDQKYATFPPNGVPVPCISLQTIRYAWPWGPIRPQFIAEFKKLYAGVNKINAARAGCVKSGGKPDPVLSFLHMVALTIDFHMFPCSSKIVC